MLVQEPRWCFAKTASDKQNGARVSSVASTVADSPTLLVGLSWTAACSVCGSLLIPGTAPPPPPTPLVQLPDFTGTTNRGAVTWEPLSAFAPRRESGVGVGGVRKRGTGQGRGVGEKDKERNRERGERGREGRKTEKVGEWRGGGGRKDRVCEREER